MSTQLQRLLENLHEELNKHPDLDPRTLDSLKVLSEDIAQALTRKTEISEDESVEASVSLSKRIQDWITDFEIRYPQLTKTLSTFAEGLADMGI
jgi:hypothetical protein